MTFAVLMVRRYFSTRAGVAIAAVAVAVAVQILVLSVMRGFRADLMAKFVGLNPHLRISESASTSDPNFFSTTAQPHIRTNSPLLAIVPIVEGEGILTIDRDIETGVKIRGVTSEALKHMPALEWALPSHHFKDIAGRWPLIASGSGDQTSSAFTSKQRAATSNSLFGTPADIFNSQSGLSVVAIGSELAAQLGITPDAGRKVTIIAPFGRISPTGDLVPQRITVTVSGVFRSGLYEFDQSLVLMRSEDAQRLLGPQANRSLWGYVADPMEAEIAARTLRDRYPELRITTWQGENAALFGALRLERVVMTTLLGLVVAIAATGIVGVLFLLGLTRQQEVGILLALGCTLRDIRRIFVMYGAIIGVVGSLIGTALALAGCAWIARGGIPLPEALYLHTLPVSVSVPGLVLMALGACALTTAAAWYPTRDLGTAAIARQLKEEEWA